jgi:hypothetical protein
MEAAGEPTHKDITVHHSWAWFIVSVNSTHIAREFDQEIARVALQSTKIPLQNHFFEETDFSGRGAWYYIWQQ